MKLVCWHKGGQPQFSYLQYLELKISSFMCDDYGLMMCDTWPALFKHQGPVFMSPSRLFCASAATLHFHVMCSTP